MTNPLSADELQKVVDAYHQHKSQRGVARALGIAQSTVNYRLRLAAEAGLLGAPRETPPGMRMGKTTLQLDAAGNVTQEWRREHPSAEDLEALLQTLERRADRCAGPPVAVPLHHGDERDPQQLLEIVVADPHIGRYAWRGDTGNSYDTPTACALVRDSIAQLAARAPEAGRILLVVSGDFFHADNRSAVTEASGHRLDVDTRWQQCIDAGRDALLDAIGDLAALCPVEVLMIPGNHDWHAVQWLARVLAAYYRRDSRVHVRSPAGARSYTRHGSCLLGHAHGDRIRPAAWAQLMAVEAAEHWGTTRHRCWHLGHIHRGRATAPVQVDEQAGVLVEYLPALCNADAWSYGQGLVGCRQAATAHLWHAEHGRRAVFEVSAQEIAAA
jgi:hypothetical protein